MEDDMPSEPRTLANQHPAVASADMARDRPSTSRADRRDVWAMATWFVIGLVGLIGFVGLTLLVASRGVIPFDLPLLDYARSFSAYNDIWNLLSNSANLPLIAIGVGLVGWLFLNHRRREGILVVLILTAITAGSE